MKYFSNIPTFNYGASNASDSALMKNIFYVIKFDVSDSAIEYYTINGVKRLDQISFELYGSTDYWWLIASINNIQDIIFDLPLSEDYIIESSKRKAKKYYDDISTGDGLSKYLEIYDKYIEENDNKRSIKVISPSVLPDIITDIVKSL